MSFKRRIDWIRRALTKFIDRKESGVVIVDEGETPEEAARRQGVTKVCIAVPAKLDDTRWEEAAAKVRDQQQRNLLEFMQGSER